MVRWHSLFQRRGSFLPNIRGVLSGVIATVVGMTAVSGPAIATAPHTALFVDGTPNSWWYQGTQVFDQADGATVTVGAAAGGELNLRADQGGDNWTWRLAPPTGASWTAGTTYQLAGYPSADYALADVQHAGATCDEAPGTLAVREAATDPETGALTAFAASYVISCYSSYNDLHGEIRWNSSVDYAAAATDVTSHNFGDRLVGSPAVTRTITVTSTGSAATVFGTAGFWSPTTAFSITGDTCSGTTRARGETCTITISAAPTRLGGDWTWLQLPDNTTLGNRYVQLGVNGLDPRTVGVSPASLSFGDQYIADRGPANTVTVTGTSAEPTTFGAATITGTDRSSFVVTADTCKGATLPKGQTCRVDVAPTPAGGGIRTAVLELPNNSLSNPRTVPLTVNGVIGSRGTYYPLSPARIMDTRTGNGAAKAKLGPNGTANLQVTGRGGVPSSGVSAVVLNVTVTEPTASGFLTVYPSGKAKPNASSLNFKRGWTRSNSVTVALGSGGKVAVNNSSGYTHAIVDVVGFYASDNSFMFTNRGVGGQFLPVAPRRLFDSRSDWGQKLPADNQVRLALDYGYDANWRMRAVVVNITAVSPTSNGFLTAWNGEWPEPKTSTVNYGAKSITPNLAVVPVRHCYDCPWGSELPTFGVYTLKDTHVVVDIVGFIDDSGLRNGLRFNARTPTRIVDSRVGQGLPANLGAGKSGVVTTPAAVATPDTRALALNVTAVAPTASTVLKVWPNGIDGINRPDASNLNAAAGQTVANAVVTLIGPTDRFNVYNLSGTTGVVADVVGTFWLYPGTSGTTVRGLTTGAPPAEPTPGDMPKPDVARR
ncbi:hypothetical protein M2302_005109 [Micromonospora sp. A200]|nr:hypothetical protein [Micromonospora sp. A200]